jgi:hypothetical protein
MAVTKEELDKIAHEYHEQDLMKDKFIEDECQFYTYNWVFENMKGCKTILEMGYGEGNFTSIKNNLNEEELKKSFFIIDIESGEFSFFDKENIKYFNKNHFIIEDHGTSNKTLQNNFYNIIYNNFTLEIINNSSRNPFQFEILNNFPFILFGTYM